jgi:hypothetical protein
MPHHGGAVQRQFQVVLELREALLQQRTGCDRYFSPNCPGYSGQGAPQDAMGAERGPLVATTPFEWILPRQGTLRNTTEDEAIIKTPCHPDDHRPDES